MFNVELTVTSGKGGGGIVSFWHEKFQPFGGPDGGDGGRGADVYITADSNLVDLSAYRSKRIFKAEGGGNGRRQKMHGRDGVDLIIGVPVGTVVYKKGDDRKTVLADLNQSGMKLMVARGGKGGLGNVHFASATDKAPRKATPGRPGESVRLLLEYKLMIDVCILGLPNSGKSTLLAQITNARPKIADYPFTTVNPVLGRVNLDYDCFTVAEMPALSVATHGDDYKGENFLTHADRAKIILFLLDGTSGSLTMELELIRGQLEKHADRLLLKKQVIAVNKMDLPEVSGKEAGIRRELEKYGLPICFISASTGLGTSELVQMLAGLLKATDSEKVDETAPEFVFRPKPISRNKK